MLQYSAIDKGGGRDVWGECRVGGKTGGSQALGTEWVGLLAAGVLSLMKGPGPLGSSLHSMVSGMKGRERGFSPPIISNTPFHRTSTRPPATGSAEHARNCPPVQPQQWLAPSRPLLARRQLLPTSPTRNPEPPFQCAGSAQLARHRPSAQPQQWLAPPCPLLARRHLRQPHRHCPRRRPAPRHLRLPLGGNCCGGGSQAVCLGA